MYAAGNAGLISAEEQAAAVHRRADTNGVGGDRMNAASEVAALLRSKNVDYTTVRRDPATRQGNLGKSGIPGDQVAKALVLVDSHGYALAVIPRSRHIDLTALEQEFGRRFRMASRDEAGRVFPGSPRRALPPIPIGGEPQTETYVQQFLVQLPDVYFQTADPRHLLHVDGESFRSLFYGTWCGGISRTEN